MCVIPNIGIVPGITEVHRCFKECPKRHFLFLSFYKIIQHKCVVLDACEIRELFKKIYKECPNLCGSTIGVCNRD